MKIPVIQGLYFSLHLLGDILGENGSLGDVYVKSSVLLDNVSLR